MTAVCTLPHTHQLLWGYTATPDTNFTYKLLDAIATAAEHAWEKEPGDDDGVSEEHMEVFQLLLFRAQNNRTSDFVAVSTLELQAVEQVIGLACEYMQNNNYADDPDFPEDAAAAQVLGNGSLAWMCETALYERTAR